LVLNIYQLQLKIIQRHNCKISKVHLFIDSLARNRLNAVSVYYSVYLASSNKTRHLENCQPQVRVSKIPRYNLLTYLLDVDGLRLAAEAFTRPYLTSICRVCSCANSLTYCVTYSMTCCGNEFQLLQTRSVTRTLKNVFRMVFGTSWDVNFHSLEYPLRLYTSGAICKKQLPSTRFFSVSILYVSIISPRSLRSFSLMQWTG